jgi:hypothetical protein
LRLPCIYAFRAQKTAYNLLPHGQMSVIGDLSSAIRDSTIDASGVFDLSRAIPVGSIVRAQKTMVFLTSGRSGRLLFELGGSR